MKIETFINNEVKKYRTQVLRQKHSKSGTNLDILRRQMQKHYFACKDEIFRQIGYSNYQEYCQYVDMAMNRLQGVDDEQFGVYNDIGKLVGYDFFRKD